MFPRTLESYLQRSEVPKLEFIGPTLGRGFVEAELLTVS